MNCLIFLCLALGFVTVCDVSTLVNAEGREDFLLVTVATSFNDGFRRFMRSAKVYNLPTKVLGMGKKWEGGDMKHAGGGHKVNLLKKALKEFADDRDKIVLFTDGYDVVLLGTSDEIVEQFKKMDARIVFSAEPYCWPDESLADIYPITESRYKYLNSGGFIGYAADLYELITSKEIKNKDDDQLFYTHLFLDKTLRDKYIMKLDTKAVIFQNLFDTIDDLELKFDEGYVENIVHNTRPQVLHSNGPSKLALNSIANYLAKSWTTVGGCLSCKEDNIDLNKFEEKDYPTVLLTAFITQPTPFLEEYLQKLVELNYPKNKIRFFIYNSVLYHADQVEMFANQIRKTSEYLSVKEIKAKEQIKEVDARHAAVEYCVSKKCDYLFNVDGVAHLDNANTLKNLIQLNRSIIAPLLVRPYKAWSNFWGALTTDGYYARSFDYMDIVNNDRRGVWNVPYITGAYLINGSLITSTPPSYENGTLDLDMAFCQNYRDQLVFLYVTNLEDYGHLVNPETFDTSRTNPDLYELFSNRFDWEQRYIHQEYAENFNPDKKPDQPCPDVYWFPVVTAKFCKHLIEVMEAFGQWSNGSNKDSRLVGGYENVPTRDIHTNQVGLEPTWMEFLRLFVRPLQEHVFIGYYHDPPKSLMNFMVRYKPDEQPSLRPHHDSSTYTINLALNRPNIDYQGGGCRFLRYNCSVTDTRLGWLLMHPGRLTHYHEGLPVTNGTRYIMISFVDP